MSAPIPVDVRRFPWIRRLAADYAYNFPSVSPFFAGDPADRAAWSAAIAATQAHPRGRTEIAAVIASQQERRGAPKASREAAGKLSDTRTVAILTGQQAGLFGGPLFTLLKAITAQKLAAQIAREHGVPAIAIFWTDAEDHDWEEVRSCYVFDDHLAARKVSLPPRQSADPSPVATVRLDHSIVSALDELEQILPPTEFRSTLVADLRAAYEPGAGMADAFAKWLERVLGPSGLVVFDSADQAAKPLARSIFARELATAGRTVQLASTAGADLVARGYHAQVTQQDDHLALFHLDGGRRGIRRADGKLVVAEKSYDPGALAREAEEQPSGFSPNVLTRPIVQDTLFPTICYVAGPNELAYLGQLRGVYAHFGVPMPLMYPRASATILDSAAVRFINKYNLPLEALQAQDEAALNELLAAQIPAVVEQSFEESSRAIAGAMERMIRVVPTIDPTLEGAAKSTLARMQHDLQTLHQKVIQAAKRRDETLRRQFMHARAQAFPDGHAQERTIGFVSFLNQFGPAFVERLRDALPLDLGRHWIVTI